MNPDAPVTSTFMMGGRTASEWGLGGSGIARARMDALLRHAGHFPVPNARGSLHAGWAGGKPARPACPFACRTRRPERSARHRELDLDVLAVGVLDLEQLGRHQRKPAGDDRVGQL